MNPPAEKSPRSVHQIVDQMLELLMRVGTAEQKMEARFIRMLLDRHMRQPEAVSFAREAEAPTTKP